MKTIKYLLILFASIIVLVACSDEEDPLTLTINLPLNETMAWQGAFIRYWPDSTELAALEYFELTLTDTMIVNDTIFYNGSFHWVEIGPYFNIDTTLSILISKTSIYLQQNNSVVYQLLLKQQGEILSAPTETRIQKILMPVSITEGKKQSFIHPRGPGWQESIVNINPIGKKQVGPFSGMGVKMEYSLPEFNHTNNHNWLLDEKGKIWSLADYGYAIRTDSVGNEIAKVYSTETHHRISKQANPEAYLKTLTLSDFYVTRF